MPLNPPPFFNPKKKTQNGSEKKKTKKEGARKRVITIHNKRADDADRDLRRLMHDGFVNNVKATTTTTLDRGLLHDDDAADADAEAKPATPTAAAAPARQRLLPLVDGGTAISTTASPRRDQQERAPVEPIPSCATSAQPARADLPESTRARASPEGQVVLDERSPAIPEKLFNVEGMIR